MPRRLQAFTANELEPFVRESNRIEGIVRDPLLREIEAHQSFTPTVAGLQAFAKAIDPSIELREHPGQNVRVGRHYPPPGGPAIPTQLEYLLAEARQRLHGADERMSPYELHLEYEQLHPFTDGNGRSGRALWLWMMLGNLRLGIPALRRGFLHSWYYQTLEAYQ